MAAILIFFLGILLQGSNNNLVTVNMFYVMLFHLILYNVRISLALLDRFLFLYLGRRLSNKTNKAYSLATPDYLYTSFM